MERPECPQSSQQVSVLFACCFSEWQILVIKAFLELPIHWGCLGECANDIFTHTDDCAQIIWIPAAVMELGSGMNHLSKTFHVGSGEASFIYFGCKTIFVSIFPEPLYKYLCVSWASVRWWQEDSRIRQTGNRRQKEPQAGWEHAAESMLPSKGETAWLCLSCDSLPGVWSTGRSQIQIAVESPGSLFTMQITASHTWQSCTPQVFLKMIWRLHSEEPSTSGGWLSWGFMKKNCGKGLNPWYGLKNWASRHACASFRDEDPHLSLHTQRGSLPLRSYTPQWHVTPRKLMITSLFLQGMFNFSPLPTSHHPPKIHPASHRSMTVLGTEKVLVRENGWFHGTQPSLLRKWLKRDILLG